jgi:hypothetical protein
VNANAPAGPKIPWAYAQRVDRRRPTATTAGLLRR